MKKLTSPSDREYELECSPHAAALRLCIEATQWLPASHDAELWVARLNALLNKFENNNNGTINNNRGTKPRAKRKRKAA